MVVVVYSGNTSTVLTQYTGVTTATINKNGSISITRNVTDPDGQATFTLEPHSNKVEITRAYNE